MHGKAAVTAEDPWAALIEMFDRQRLLVHIHEDDDYAKDWILKIDDCGAAGRE